MPKAKLGEPYHAIEATMIDTMMAALQESRPDLHYPESHSDMQACARGLLRMFHVERRALAIDLPVETT